jgi:hypothetical protein
MSLRAKFFREVSKLGLPAVTSPLPVVTETDLLPLPEPAQRYLRFMGVMGRPRDWSFRTSFAGRFKVKQDAPWRPCEVWQYNTGAGITRTFYMKMRFGGLPVIGRDTYREGHGRMLGKLLDLITVIDGSGPEFDIGELVTYLNDLVLVAPSMLLVPAVVWTAVDARSFDLSLTDHGHTVRARVFLDDRGAPVNFETTDRFCDDPANPKKLMRARWTTPMEGFQDVNGRQVPTKGQAVWHLPTGELPYAEFELVPESLAFNVRPGE